MQFRFGTGSALPGFWLAPMLFGALLVLVGVLIVVMPNLLQILVASLFMLAGLSLFGIGLRMRRAQQVVYRRMDGSYSDMQ